MTEDIAAAFLALPLTLLFGCLAVFVVSESRRIHPDPGSDDRISRRMRDRPALMKRGSMPASAEQTRSDGRERSA